MKNFINNINIITATKRCAHLSLLSGTAIFLTYAVTKATEVMVFAVFFIIVAALTNGIMLLILSIELLVGKYAKKEIFGTILMTLSNIPIAIFYAWLALQIADLNHINL